MIVVYTKTHCPNCVKLKNRLVADSIEFSTINIETDETVREWLIGEGHKSVPQVYIDGRHVDDDMLFKLKVEQYEK